MRRHLKSKITLNVVSRLVMLSLRHAFRTGDGAFLEQTLNDGAEIQCSKFYKYFCASFVEHLRILALGSLIHVSVVVFVGSSPATFLTTRRKDIVLISFIFLPY